MTDQSFFYTDHTKLNMLINIAKLKEILEHPFHLVPSNTQIIAPCFSFTNQETVAKTKHK